MKYTIEGFLQKTAVELGLDVLDLVILRCFIDFKDSGNMRYQVFNGEKYYWIFHKKLVQELPLLSIQKIAFYKNLKKMCDAKVLKKYIIRFAGTYTYYAVVENFIHLISTNNENTEPNIASLEYNFKDNYSFSNTSAASDTTSDSFGTTPHATLGTTPDSSAPTPTMSKCDVEPTNFAPVKLESYLNSFETSPLDFECDKSDLDSYFDHFECAQDDLNQAPYSSFGFKNKCSRVWPFYFSVKHGCAKIYPMHFEIVT
ncbi:hypothetical protein [Intestinibacter sp.]